MKCVICKNGETNNPTVTVTLEQGVKTFVLKEVPARVCFNCGEQSLDEETLKKILSQAQAASLLGTELTITRFKAA